MTKGVHLIARILALRNKIEIPTKIVDSIGFSKAIFVSVLSVESS